MIPLPEHALVDVHAHFTTPHYIELAKAAGHVQPDGMPESYWPEWSAEQHLALMERLGVRTSILSISSPGIEFATTSVPELAAEVNDVAAGARRNEPGRFGFFASLPVLEEDAARQEIRRSFDDLHAAGVVLMSNTAGAYLGDPRLEPVLAELDRRRAVLFLHPTTPVGFEAISTGRPAPMAEFLFDTARTVFDFALSGAAARFKNIQLIIPHMGGTIPVLASRVELFRGITDQHTGSLDDLLARAWWDLAGVPNAGQIGALVELADPRSLLYGTDYNWTRAEAVEHLQVGLDELLGRHVKDWRSAVGANADRLLGAPDGRLGSKDSTDAGGAPGPRP